MRHHTNGFATAGRMAGLLALTLMLAACAGQGLGGSSVEAREASFQAGADRPPSAHTLDRLARQWLHRSV